MTGHNRKPLKQWADIDAKTTVTPVITSVAPRRWWQPLRQCNTMTGHDRGGARGSGRIERRAGPPDRGDASQRGAVGCPPVMSSRVPARERILVVRYKRTDPEEGGRKDRQRASHNQQTGHGKSFWDDHETDREHDISNRGFPHKRYKPSKPRPTLTESPTS